MAERRNKVTMSEIARESGVSLSTVSLVINDRPGLPKETRQRVLSIARQLGYEMRTPTPGISKPVNLSTIGVLVKRAQGDSAPPSSNIFFSHVISGVEAGCRQENVALLYSTLPVDDNNRTLEVPRLISDPRVDGLLLVGNYIDERLYAALRQRSLPIVLVEAYSCAGEFDSVIIENSEGSYAVIKHLVEKGHRHIAYVGSFPDSQLSFRYRRQAYVRALNEYGIQETYYADCSHNDREAVIQATRRLLTEHPQVTALFTCNDEVALIAMHAVREFGKDVPHDISIVGFDNNANVQNSYPPLTTVDVDKVSMGRLAVQLIINRAENPDQGCVKMHVHTRLVERQSVRDLRIKSKL